MTVIPGFENPQASGWTNKKAYQDVNTVALRNSTVSVLDFGARDGQDIGPALQSAIDALAGGNGGTVLIPPSAGDWVCSPFMLRTSVRVRGAGRRATRLKLVNGANTSFVTLADGQVEDSGMSDLTLDGNKTAQTAGHTLYINNTGYDNTRAYPSMGDPDHIFERLWVVNGKQHNVYTAGPYSQSQFRSVFAYDADNNNFRIESPDNHFDHCVAARSGDQGFYVGGNSNRFLGVKSWLSGRLVQANGAGIFVQSVNRNDFTHCEAQDNRKDGFSLNGVSDTVVVGCRSDRNGLGPSATGGVGDGIQVANITNSIIGLQASDRNSGGFKQRWGYNASGTNSGNIVNIAIGDTSSGAAGNGSFGTTSTGVVKFKGTTITAAFA